jgi:glycosyltransferase involved in cell wall biosynthesis
MKMLYVAPYRAKSNLGAAATRFILGLDKLGVDIVPRPLLTEEVPNTEIPTRLIELEQKSEVGCDVCVQHMKPELMDYDGNFKTNVAIPYENFIVDTEINRLHKKFDVVVNTLAPPLIEDDYKNLPEPLRIPAFDGKFVFYFIGKMRKRKNLEALLRAFHLEFHPDEPVELLIKSYIPSLLPEQAKNEIQNLCQAQKAILGRWPIEYYKKEFIISEFVTDREMLAIHRACDCLVVSSHGDSFNTVIVDALAVGNSVLYADAVGLGFLYEFSGNCLPVLSQTSHPLNMTIQDDEVFRGAERWTDINITDLRNCMRGVYQTHKRVEKPVLDRLIESPQELLVQIEYGYESR